MRHLKSLVSKSRLDFKELEKSVILFQTQVDTQSPSLSYLMTYYGTQLNTELCFQMLIKVQPRSMTFSRSLQEDGAAHPTRKKCGVVTWTAEKLRLSGK